MTRRGRVRTGHVVSHTHWDRAWYWTFEQTRVRLVDLMDDLLALMARDPDYRHFVLDGQLAMVEDYLTVRPDRREAIARLVRAGRLLLGPLYVLPDLFLPGGESLVRNLRAGHRAARGLGPVMKLGYLPDPFGHPAQLPQILRGFGIDGALMSRGAGDEADWGGQADFLWRAPDGSEVLATHQMAGGYCNLAALGHGQGDDDHDPDDHDPGDHDPGDHDPGDHDPGDHDPGDHDPDDHDLDDHDPDGRDDRETRARRQLDEVVARLSPHCPHRQLLLNNGCDHLPPQPELPGLLRRLQRGRSDLRLIHSTPPRYHRAVRQAMARGAFEPAVFEGELRGSRLHNLLPGVLSARQDLKQAHQACETLLLHWAEPWSALARAFAGGRDHRALLEQGWRTLLLCQPHDDICGCSVDAVHDDDLNRMARVQQLASTVRDAALEALARAAGQPALVFNPHPWPVRAVVERAGQSIPLDLPPLGHAPPVPARPPRPAVGVVSRSSGVTLTAGHLQARLRRGGGVGVADDGAGLVVTARLVDEGDAGDSYDFDPPASQRTIQGLARPGRLQLLETGPLRGAALLRGQMVLPRRLAASRRARARQLRRLPVELLLRLTAGSPVVELEIEVDNQVHDHRLRLELTLPFAADAIHCGAPFHVATRPLVPPARPDWFQPPAPTQPMAGFAALERPGGGGLALFAPGLHEIEARPRTRGRGTRVWITLLRCVGWLSRDDLSTRRGEAGPCWPVSGAQMAGRHRFRVGLMLHRGRWRDGEVLRRLAEHRAPPRLVELTGQAARTGTRAALPDSFLRVEPATVQLSCLAPTADGGLEARLVNLGDRAVTARLEGPFVARERGLDGRGSRRRVDLRAIPLGPWQIRTLALSAR